LLLHERLALERRAGEILAASRECLSCLSLELLDLLLELLRLKLQSLFRGDDVGDAALDILEQLALLLVGIVERDRRVLRTIEQAWGLPRLGRSATARPITGIWR